MKPPDARAALACCLLSTTVSVVSQAQQADSPLAYDLGERENWYRIEILVFAREDEAALTAEVWDPLPELKYPDNYRFLLNPSLADQRLSQTGAQLSAFDSRGVQQLTLARPPEGLDPLPRPDFILAPEPETDPALDPAPDTVEAELGAAAPGGTSGLMPDSAESTGEEAKPQTVEIDPNTPLLTLPFTMLNPDALEFRSQARQLQRRGSRILFHAAWWVPLEEGTAATTVALDRGADGDQSEWPELQGSISLYRTRYLHADVDLWLNTAGGYLPPEWSIPAPPLPTPSLRVLRHDGSEQPLPIEPLTLDDLLPPLPISLTAPPFDPTIIGQDSLQAPQGQQRMEATVATEDAEHAEAELTDAYTYRHAIAHKQSRRMRGGELHYLDHPVIGVVLRLTPVNEETLPLDDAQNAQWRERHSLPVERALPAGYEDNAVPP